MEAHGSRLQPIDTSTLHERAYLHLRNALMAGLFRPGESVTLRGVASALGTSVMPVREAVRRLVSERALEMPSSRSIRVPLMSEAHFDELCACRTLLEGEAAALAAPHVDSSLIEELKTLDAEFSEAAGRHDAAAMLKANQAFHFAIYQKCGSSLLFSMIEKLWLQSGPYLNLVMGDEREKRRARNSIGPHHKKVIAALAGRDGPAAKAALVGDINEASKVYRSKICELS